MKEKELRELMEQLAAVEARANSIAPLAETADDSEIEAREKELNQISEERKELEVKIAEVRKEIDAAKAVEEGRAKVTKVEGEKREMKKTLEEIRKSHEYAMAYAEAIKTGKDEACRAIIADGDEEARSVLTVNGGGDVPVPTMVEERIRTAWENEEITRRIGKTYVKGNLQIGFEVSGTDAVIHLEGTDAPQEEKLVIGIVSLIPHNLKKWITISDEVMSMTGEAFLNYIYDEIAYKIAKLAADTVVAKIVALPEAYPQTIDEDHPAIPIAAKVALAPSATTVATAYAYLSDEARDNVVIMNKLTYATFKSITTADGYPLADPFDGLPVIFNNSLKAYDAASANDTYAIVGDLGSGFRANFPDGEQVTFKFDDLSLAEKDLVKVVGKEFVALEVVAPGRFTRITKPGASA